MELNDFYNYKDAKIYNSKINDPMVSVCIITYNKKEFIRETIESVLMQKTQYAYEIVIGDNASSDGTQQILREYYENQNDKMTIILNYENLELTNNMFRTMSCCKGKYIVILYGDDYWISENKIENQVNFLENNNEYIGASTVIESRYNDSSKREHLYPEIKFRNSKIDIYDFLSGHNFPMAGLMFRNMLLEKDGRDYVGNMVSISRYIDDLSFCVLLLNKGRVFIIDEVTAVYRIFKPGSQANNFNSVNKGMILFDKNISLLNKLDDLFNNKYSFKERYIPFLGVGLRSAIVQFKFREFIKIYRTIPKKYRKLNDNVLIEYLLRKLTRLVKFKEVD